MAMALVLMDGFDNYNNVAVDIPVAGGYTGVAAPGGLVAGRNTPGKALSFATGGNLNAAFALIPLFAASPAVLKTTLGFAMALHSLTSTGPSVTVKFNNDTYLSASSDNVGTFQVNFAADGGVIAFGNSGISAPLGVALGKPNSDNIAGNWHYYEIQATTGVGQVCYFTVKIDGVSVLAAGPLNFAIRGWGGFTFTTTGSSGSSTLLDDLYLLDDNPGSPPNAVFTDFLGICQITTLFPTSDGSNTQFTPVPVGVPPHNYLNVRDVMDDADVSYNTASTAGKTDSFVSNGNFNVGQTILAVQPMISVRKDDTGSVRQIQTLVKSGAASNGGVAKTLLNTYAFAKDIYPVDPTTGNAWTASTVNALEFGYTIVS